MPIEDCEDEVAKAGGGADGTGMSKGDARKLLDAVDRRAARLQREQGLSASDAATQAGKEIADQAAAVAAVQQRNQLMNLQKRMTRRAAIEATAQALGGKTGVDLVRAIRNTMVALETDTRGARRSAEASQRTWHDLYTSGLTRELDRAGLFAAARSGDFERDWGRELYQLSLKDAGETGDPGYTGNATAAKIAAIVQKYTTWAKGNLNREGAWIGDYSGYISRTVHNGDKMRQAGPDAWMAAISPLLDHDRTFEGSDNFAASLRGTFNALVTGVHLSDAGGVGFKDPAFTGPANVARKMSEGRELHFKDADSWLAYQKKFGNGTLLEQVYSSLGRAAHQQGLLEKFGTNPEGEFGNDIQWAREKYRDTHTEAVDALGQARKGLQDIFDTLTGEANRPANRLAANIARYVRLDESMAKLGMVMFTHVSAMVNKAGEAHYGGEPWMKAYGDFFASPFRNMKHGEAAQFADETLAGMQGTSRDVLSAFSLDDSVPGTASRLANTFFKLSGLTWLLNKQKAGAEWMFSRRYGAAFDTAHDDLAFREQRALREYDISPAEWDILRRAPDHAQIDGRSFLTPQAAIRAPDEGYAAMLRENGTLKDDATDATVARRVDDARQALMLKVHGALSDTADRSVVTPGVETHALMLHGTHPGTLNGEFLRFIAQFKMWPVAAIQQQWRRDLSVTGDTMGKIGGVMNLAVGSMVTGYAIMTLKDLLKGQNPRSPLDPRTAAAALMQGGGLGIFGDYLFGEYSRMGSNFAESVLGPVLGQGIANVMDLWNRIKARAEGTESANMKEHPLQDIGPDAFKVLTDNLPFVNLFYVRQAFNYLFLHSLQETMRPGYLRRAEKSLQQRTGTTMYMSPAENHLHTFGR